MCVLAKARKKRELVELLSTEAGKCLLKLRRRLVKSFLDLLVLMELRSTHLSGYDVMTLVYRRFRILLGSGSVYSLLYRMEREGLIAGTWTERRRIYGLTDKGKAVASATDEFFEDFMDLDVFTTTH